MATTYNFTDSLDLIDAMLASEIPEKPGRAIPSLETINASAVYMPQANKWKNYCGATYIDGKK